MKKLLIILLLICPIYVFAQETEDTVERPTQSTYDMVDSLETLLKQWYYYTGRDTICYLKDDDKAYFDTELPDSLFKVRVENISTPLNIVYNDKVQQYIDKYVKRGHRLAPKLLGLSHQYFMMFEEKLDAYGIPLELKYLSVIESALNPRAKSPAGAVGLWQFMYKTGLVMGLEITSYIDERMDPEKSTDAACRYLKLLHSTYNDWTLALAAYNAGPGRINAAIKRSGKSTYWEIYPYLPEETRNYVPGFIAMMYMFENHKLHNFKPEKIDFFEDVDTVMVKKQLHFAQLDSVLGIPVEETRELNPQYKLDIVPAKTKQYPLKMQRKYINQFLELEDSIYSFNDSVIFNLKKVDFSKSATYSREPSGQPAGTNAVTYSVKSGDVLGSIAQKYGVTVSNIKSWNGLSSDRLQIGQKLKIYVKSTSNSSSSSSSSSKSSAKSSTDTKTDSKYEYYTVKSGDTPSKIAAKYDGVTAEDIIKLNGIDPAKLQIGQKLKIRKK
ncbi:MAG: LysM peptidoglycan-binding domain-containing protein [Bacteroidales bacterium]|nr:LysM peptidoglycan-binding domain-containing protein [Bacteroidales bacterium]